MKQYRKVFISAVLFFILSALLSLCMGAANLSLSQLFAAIKGGTETANGRIFWYARLPRTAACLLAGAALAVSGAVIQGVLANKLASPGIIGVNSGAGLAVTLCCAFGVVGGWHISAAAFLGAVFSAFLITLAAQKTGASRTTVILGGVALNSFFNAVTEGITIVIPEVGMMNADFRAGGFSSVSHIRLVPAAVLIIAAMAAIFTLCSELDIMTMGEQTAQGLGVNVKLIRTVLLVLASLLAGAAVSFSGLLGFVGLIVPHAARKFSSGESAKLLPLCAIIGGGFVAFCDVFARVAFSPYELPVGIFMAVLGGPFFVMLLLKSKGGRLHG